MRLDLAALLEFVMNYAVQFTAGLVVWGNDQRALGKTGILLGDCLESFFPVFDLSYPPLAVQVFDGDVNFATGKLLNCFLERRVLLADDLVQMRGSHSGFL